MKNATTQTTWNAGMKSFWQTVKVSVTSNRPHSVRNDHLCGPAVRRAGRNLNTAELELSNIQTDMKGGGRNGTIQLRLLGNTCGI